MLTRFNIVGDYINGGYTVYNDNWVYCVHFETYQEATDYVHNF